VQGIDIDGFSRLPNAGVSVVACAASRLADPAPVGRFVAGAAEAFGINESLQQVHGRGILHGPILRQLTSDQPEQVTGQMRHAHPGRNEKAHVVENLVQVGFACGVVPSDKCVACGHRPCRRAKEQAADGALMTINGQVADGLAHAGAETEVVVRAEQGLPQIACIGAVGLDEFNGT